MYCNLGMSSRFVSLNKNPYFQISLINKSLLEAQQILKCGHVSGLTNLTIEYDVSVMQSVEFSLGPLLIEIERPMNDKLGLVLSNYSNIQHLTMDKKNEISPAGIYIASILPASIADRYTICFIGLNKPILSILSIQIVL